MIKATYKITWLDVNVIQTKNLISHNDYLDIIKPNRVKIHELELDKINDNTAEIKRLKKEIALFGDSWFTDNSLISDAMETGLMQTNYGNFNVKFEQII